MPPCHSRLGTVLPLGNSRSWCLALQLSKMAPIQPHPSNRCLQLVATITTATFPVAGVREIGAISLTLGVCGLIKNDLPSPVYLKSCHQGVALFKEPADVAFLEEMCYQGRALRFSKAQGGPSGAVFSVAWDPDVALSAPPPAHLPVCHHAPP